MLLFRLLLVSCVLALAPAWAAPEFKGGAVFCSNHFEKAGRLGLDSSVELEMPVTKNLMNLFTTEDGTVGPVLYGMPPPAWLAMKSKKPEKLAWDRLSFPEKKRLILESAKYRQQYFFHDRVIHGLRIRDSVDISVKESIEFLGKTLRPGKQKMDLSDFLVNKVEFQNIDSVETLRAVELHFRTDRAAGLVSESATVFQALVEGSITHQHVHVVVPVKNLKGRAAAEALPFTDFYRRVNLFEEIVGNLEGAPTAHVSRDSITFFSSLTDEDLGLLYRWWKGGAGYDIGDELKMPWVGFHGPDKYDAPDVIGFQFRRIDENGDIALRRQRLSTIQAQMMKGEWKSPSKRLDKWARQTGGDSPGAAEEALVRSWAVPDQFQEGWLAERASPHVRGVLEKAPGSGETLQRLHDLNRGVFHVLHDWSRDPLFFDQPKALARIARAQEAAAKELAGMAGQKLSDDELQLQSLHLVDIFWRDSGIAEAVAHSLKMDVVFHPDLPDNLVKGIDPALMKQLRSVPRSSKSQGRQE